MQYFKIVLFKYIYIIMKSFLGWKLNESPVSEVLCPHLGCFVIIISSLLQ